MSEGIVTAIAKEKMLKARAGIAPLPRIAGMAFGDGAKDSSGEIIPASPDQSKLHHELLRKKIDGYKIISKFVYRYTCTLEKKELENKYINEVALYDEDGDIIAIKSFLDKGKDGNQEMGFEIDDTF